MNPCRLIPLIPLACLATARGQTESLADGLERTLVARDPLVINPVDVSVDVDGAVYTVETTRRKTADLDIRDFRQWIPESLSHTSVKDRLEFYRRSLAPAGDTPKPFADLTRFSEKVHRLVDRSGDGTIDHSAVFAEGFDTPVTGVAAGVMAWRGDVYATIVPDLWKLRDTTGDGVADRREALLTGFGIHIAYAGHDMHGIKLGPDGKIYWTIGDKAANVVSKEGKRWKEPFVGLLMRCNPDGTGYEVVARGLRNVQQIAFDDFGNIFGVDNDSDASGEKERFVHIVEGSDTGWRIYYQYRGSDYNPWMRESMSVPSGEHQPAYILPALSTYVDGPSGLARDPGTALNDRYRGYFFMSGFPAGLLYAFTIEPAGASFRMTDSHVIDRGPAYVGMNFGPDGALYLADWGGGYSLNEKGAVWKIDDPRVAGGPLRREVAEMLRAGADGVADEALVARLGHPDQRVRSDAHLALADRPSGRSALATAAARLKESPVACSHALWGLARGGVFDAELLRILLAAEAPETRAQAAKWAGETAARATPELIPLLADPSGAVRYHAAVAIGRLAMDEALEPVLAMLRENANRDHHLRHAGVMALLGMAPETAARAAAHPDAAVRLAAAVVFRRTAAAEVATLLADPVPEVVSEATRSIYDEEGIPAAMPALAELTDAGADAPVPAMVRSIAANRRLADAASAARLARFAADDSRPSAMRVAALRALASWPEASQLDAVDGRWNPLAAADPEPARAAFAPFASALRLATSKEVAKAAGDAALALQVVTDPAGLAREAADPEVPVARRLQALAGLRSADPERFRQAAAAALRSDAADLRPTAAAMLAGEDPATVTAYAVRALEHSPHIPERQAALGLLGGIESAESTAALLEFSASATDEPALHLEWLEVAAGRPALKPAADELVASLAAKGPLGPHLPALTGGDVARGRGVFENHLAAQCTACHRIGDEGSNVGPPLTTVGNRGREHLLESLVLPQAEITPGYGVMSVVKRDGTTVGGTLIDESDDVLVLQTGEDTLRIPKAEIAEQTPPLSTMPAMGDILDPRELRDLLEFLASLK